MGGRPPLQKDAFRARALLLGARLELKAWPEAEALARMPLAVRAGAGGVAVLFRYGVAVLFDVTPEDETALRQRLAPHLEHRYRSPEAEELEARVQAAHPEGMQETTLLVQSAGIERLQLIAEALSRSLLLAHYETRIAADFDSIEPLALQLERRGSIPGRTREHVKRIGALLLIAHRMVGRAEIGEKPELLWDHPELERLYGLLEAEFELRERLAALERKLALIGQTVRTLVELLDTRHALRVEWYIVALIAFEITLSLYQMFLR